jgi:hypothetical protein
MIIFRFEDGNLQERYRRVTKLKTTLTRKDGTTEIQRPERKDGMYWVEVPIKDEAEMERLVAKGYAVRVRGEKSGQWNLKRI